MSYNRKSNDAVWAGCIGVIVLMAVSIILGAVLIKLAWNHGVSNIIEGYGVGDNNISFTTALWLMIFMRGFGSAINTSTNSK